MAKSAAKRVGAQQVRAINKIREYTEKNMDPALLAAKAKEQDIQRAKDRLALQAEIDPELAKQRMESQKLLSEQLSGIGSSESDRIAALAAKEAATGTPGMEAVKAELVDRALTELRAGATLPADVQAELMQAGLQRAGQVTGTGGAAPGSVGSSILSQVLGTAGLNLRAQRATQAAELATAASNLESQRQQILQQLFPNLQNQQLKNISATSGILQQSNQMLPQVGLGGSDVANAWLARVGALNQLAANKASVNAAAAMAEAQAKQNIWGTVSSVGQWKASGQGEGGGGGTGIDIGGIASLFNTSGGGAGSSFNQKGNVAGM
jgi:hypothetical protein